MNRTKFFNIIGFSLLGLCFIIAGWNVLSRTVREADPNVITIRFAHWQLEGGLRDTFEMLSRKYEEFCAEKGLNVRVEQIPIPERVFPNWLITQLVGGKAPQIIALDNNKGMTTDRIARFFEPISGYIEEPNPYNAGTPLDGVPWRSTFVDGLSRSYDANLLDYYSIPLSTYTFRLFYNKPLYHEIFGDAPVPTNYRDFIKACEKIVAYGKEHGTNLVPIAGSKYNAPLFTDIFTGTQTQKLARRINRSMTLLSDDTESRLAYLRGEWNVRSPEITDSLRLLKSISRFFQPGFQQVERDSATFYFVQSRCVFVAAGSWDNVSLRIQAPFEIGVCRIPVPTKDDPEYGKNMFGPPSELSNGTSLALGLVRGSAHFEQALDFLRYLSSYTGNSLFSQNSGWLPSVIKVPVAEELKIFEPVEDGYPNAFGLGMGAETARIRDNNYYLLQAFPNSPEAFQQGFEKSNYARACVGDLRLWLAGNYRVIMRLDTLLAANRELALNYTPEDQSRSRKFYELIELQITQEANSYSAEMDLYELTKEKN